METDHLARLIGQKNAILLQLGELSRRQSDLIQNGDMTRLMSLLAAKQVTLQSLQGVEQELDPFREQDPDGRRWRSPELRLRVRQVATENESLLEEIMHIERDCESCLARRRDHTVTRLHGVQDSTSARKAYLQARSTGIGKLDLTSES